MLRGMKPVNYLSRMQDEINHLAVNNLDLLRFCRLLAFIDSPIVPKTLLERACRSRTLWTESGELAWVPPRHSKVPSWLVHQFGTTKAWQASPILPQAIEKDFLSISQNGFFIYFHLKDEWRTGLRAGSHQATSLEPLFDILAVVIHAFPEIHAEILWEEIEEQLWDVVGSTVLPLLAVLSPADILAHLQAGDDSSQTDFLRVFLRFLSRISAILGNHCPSSVLRLHEHFYEHLLTAKWSATPSPREELPRHIFFAPAVIQRANLSYQRNKEQSNPDQVLNTSCLLEVYHGAVLEALSSDHLAWAPLVRSKPSCTMEILARAILDGVANNQKLIGIFLPRLHSQFPVLLGFLAARQQSFELARDMLESSIDQVRNSFGVVSMEYLITGIELVKCYNFLLQEVDGENLAQKLWNEVFHGKRKITSLHQTYLAAVLSDSLIGQAKYDVAESTLLSILDYLEISCDMVVSTSLRLLKMSRRQRKENPGFDTWKLLERAVNCIEDVANELKLEFVEESMCHISLMYEDLTQLPRAEAVMTNLSRISLEHYSGSESSMQILNCYMAALQSYREEFNLFSVTGPHLHFSRLIRDGFPSASISLIERIGTANWNRFNRVKELPLRINISMGDPCTTDGRTIAGKSEGTFVDSALGSSLQTASRRARSQISYLSVGSAIEGSLENFPPIPIESAKGKTFECPICCKRLRGIVSAAQWEHHVYADLQPYVCIVDDCSSNLTAFGSRLDFTNHMAQHQDIVVWSCSVCRDTQDNPDAIRKHISHAHPDMEIESAVISNTVHRNMAKEQCPFCGVVPGTGFVGHLCRHLEEVALTILPKDVGWDSESDSDNSSSLSIDADDYSQRLLLQGEEIVREEREMMRDRNAWNESGTTVDDPSYRTPRTNFALNNIDFSRANYQETGQVLARMDTGSDINIMSEDYAARQGLVYRDVSGQTSVSTPDGTKILKDPSQNGLSTYAYKRDGRDAITTVTLRTGGVKPRIQFGSLTEDDDPEAHLKNANQGSRFGFVDKQDRSDTPGPLLMANPRLVALARPPSPIIQPSSFTGRRPLATQLGTPKIESPKENIEYGRDSKRLNSYLPPDDRAAQDSNSTMNRAYTPDSSAGLPWVKDILNDLRNRPYLDQLLAFQKSREFSFNFPSSISERERQVVHTIAGHLGLTYITQVNGDECYVSVTKRMTSNAVLEGKEQANPNKAFDGPQYYAPYFPRGPVLFQQFDGNRAPAAANQQQQSSSETHNAARITHPPQKPMLSHEAHFTVLEPGLERDSRLQRPADEEAGEAFAESESEENILPPPSQKPPLTSTSEGGPSDPGQQSIHTSESEPIFQLPRKNAAIPIKHPDGTPIDLTKAREPPVPGSTEYLEERAAAAEAALICIGCNRRYKSKKKWRKHIASHGRGLFLCRAGCGERFYTLEGRRVHEASHFTGREKKIEGGLINIES
ncbi:hypothetical protein DL98DRAFT_530840 [Cadophora sp. DSE1049]|nr:hypothetical protein DL98DRAFT_530840 [Cadophora sp. DSE1049]